MQFDVEQTIPSGITVAEAQHIAPMEQSDAQLLADIQVTDRPGTTQVSL